MAGRTPKTGMQGTVRKVSVGARVLDAILCAVFAYFAFTTTGGWQVFWALSAIFCAFTAATGPLDRLPALIQRIMGVKRGG